MFLPDIDSIDNWKPGGSLDLVKATGGKLEGLRKNRIIVRVTPESSLDVAAVRPKLPDTETKEDIDERTETTLTNAQIILGKLYRTEQIVTRDAFDIVSAAKGDPRALEIAVNTLNSDELRVVRGNLFAGNDSMAREAGDVLKGITPRVRNRPPKPGSERFSRHEHPPVPTGSDTSRERSTKRPDNDENQGNSRRGPQRKVGTERTPEDGDRSIHGGECRDLKS